MYLDASERTTLLRLARFSLEHFVRTREKSISAPSEIELTERLREPAGVFVTLEEEDQLRGCIGYIEPIRPLYQAVMENSVSACSRDYRFLPVTPEELDRIKIEISVLTPKEEIAEPSGFHPGEEGIILEKEGKRAVFLPQVAPEQGWDREETLRHLCMKAGLPPDAWREGTRFWIFRAEVFSEEER
ncbi:MAG: AmmeMemoRadiSam system protein A [Deltaproteobacteria bacterium]|nr:AmmeMemoRadiSam system protein A [Deltaproteobacteria bacterium]